MIETLISASKVVAKSNKSRVLVQGLNLTLGREKVALIGRNGVGKSTLLSLLAGQRRPDSGRVVQHTRVHLVGQTQVVEFDGPKLVHALRELRLPIEVELQVLGLSWDDVQLRCEILSHGELRKLRLLYAKLRGAEMLLLDEPTQDLDALGCTWLKSWLRSWQGGLLVASHNRSLLEEFDQFFMMAESGCRSFKGSFSELQRQLDEEYRAEEERYLRRLSQLAQKEEKTRHVARRRGRKKRFGRVSELDRATPRSTLNQKRDYAQVKHGRMKRDREAKLGAFREWTKCARRGLRVELPLVLPSAGERSPLDTPVAEFREVCVEGLFSGVNLSLGHDRLAVVGPNGSGKTTLLRVLLRDREPSFGVVRSDLLRIGCVAQAGEDWCLRESLLERLGLECGVTDPKTLAELLMAHKFPLSLAERPLRSLSPGERVRAALICLFQRRPTVDMLVLDEPTYSLDLLGQSALVSALKAWTGGLVVASHDRGFLRAIGVDQTLELGGVCCGA